MFTISKSYQFEAAHRLVAPYIGKCNSVHGHSFRVTLTLSSEELNSAGMVADFTSLKPVGKWIMASLDHAMIVAEGDLSLIDWLKRNQQKYFVVNSNPTSEVIAKVIFAQAQALGFELATVTVSETCTASATFSKK